MTSPKLSLSILITFTLWCTQVAHAAVGDPIDSIVIRNIAANAADINQAPVTPHGIAFHDGYLWAMDFGTDRIYRVYLEDGVDQFGNPVLKGDSDFNIPVSELTTPQLPGGGDMPVCGAYPGDQYCGGGGLVHVNGYLWNASPVTDNILKIDPTDGAIQSAHIFTNHTFPSPSSLTYDGTHFWVIDWQSNQINKVLAETGEVLEAYDGPANIGDPRPTGIVWDGLDLWLSYEAEERIYRVRPNTAPLLDVLDYFDAPGAVEGGGRPKGLAWDGEFLWHADSGTGKIYKLETDIMPFGITGCIMKNIIGVDSGVILSQAASPDRVTNTDDSGCFQFSSFEPGVPIALQLDENGVNGRPFIQLNDTDLGDAYGPTDVILIQNQTPYDESNYGYVATDPEDGTITNSVTATPNVIDTPSLIDISTINETGITVEYNVVDSDGNHAEPVTRTVFVLPPDVTPPVITLNGASTMVLEQNINNPNLYVEAGATAEDDRDGDVTDRMVITGNVDSSIAGDYVITYTVDDRAGNVATETRTITVRDTTAPVITLQGANPLEMERSQSAYSDPGATAVDNIDGTINLNSSHMSGTVRTDTVGSYTITYSYTDAGGNEATRSRTVNVVDTGAPTITLNGASTINHEVNTPYTDPGAVATDDFGEVISANVVPTGSVNVNVIGTYTLTYNISDASGNAAPTVTRRVIVDDTGAPTITLIGNQTINLQRGDAYVEEGATASDAVDNNATLTNNIVITGNVNSNVNGTYTRYYNVTDSAGNAAPEVTRTIIVADTGIPVITLNGNQTINLQRNDPYVEQGATATDASDDDTQLTNNIVISGSVNTSVLGTYTVRYNVTDSSGNAAEEVVRTINVSDTGIPVITLNGNQTMNLQKNDPFTDPGATASDSVDGNLTSSIVVTGSVNTSQIGTYTLRYNVTDSAGNAADEVVRTINVSDTGIPVITLIGNQTINLQRNDPYVEQGATATDSVDDDATLTSNISIAGTVNTASIGTYYVRYNVSDSAGNAAVEVTRTVNVSDTGIPVITLNGNQTINLQRNDPFTDPGATASDSVDGNLTSSIVVTGSVDTSQMGTYTLRYNVNDSAGNAAAEVTRTVIVSDTGIPVITLNGNQTMNLQRNDNFTDPGATASDSVDGNLTNDIQVTGSVNTSVLGTYTLRYNVTDSAGNAANEVTRTVIVSDTGIPVITLNGNQTINLQRNDPFSDPGATANDSVDGDLTNDIQVTGSVDTSTIGTYTLRYNVTDSAGNAAVEVTRTINVSDTGMPVISLIGNQTIRLQTNEAYVEPGANATDAVDDDATLTANIVITGTVDTSVNGTYTRYYNVTDSAGNAAVEVTRTIIVEDSGSPVITLNGLQTVYITRGEAYVEEGATATDAVDDDATLTANINITGVVDTGTLGTYTRTYTVTDSSGNAATPVTRTIIVQDVGIPVLTLIGSNPINHEKGQPFSDPGASAWDAVDGDMGTVFSPDSVFVDTSNTYTLSYDVTDTAGNPAVTVYRDVIVQDTEAPIITMNGSATINHEQGDAYTDAGATANDSYDGNVTVTTTGSVNVNVSGTYNIHYDAVDNEGNNATRVTRTINVADTIAPSITLLGDAVMDHVGGTPFVDPGYTAEDNFDGNITDDVVTAFVNNGDQYLLSYDVTDAAGNAAPTQNRTVNVVTPTTVTIEAETASISGAAAVATSEAGFQGSGYIDLNTAASGDTIDYTFDAYGVNYDLTIRHASTSTTSIEILVNGSDQYFIDLTSTGGANVWQDTSALTLPLISGSNTLRINISGASPNNVDTITFTPN